MWLILPVTELLTCSCLSIHFSCSLSSLAVRSRSHTPLSTVQEVLLSAPESATTVRRRARKERKEAEEAKLREEWERALSSRYQYRRPYDRSTPGSRYMYMYGKHFTCNHVIAACHMHKQIRGPCSRGRPFPGLCSSTLSKYARDY